MADFESLPILALQNIFHFFSLAERQRLRRISKKSKLAVETMRPQRDLCIYRHSYPFEEKWAFSNEKIASEDMLYCNLSDRSKLIPFIGDLERLYLFWVRESSRFFLQDLPLLNKLKVLIIREQYSCLSGYEKLELLSSSSLEKLSITFANPTGTRLDLDTPSLHSLVVWEDPVHSNYCYHFRYPLSIRYLQCVEFNSMLAVCRNLQELICQQISFPFDLKEYQSLQKVNIYPLLDDEHDSLNRLIEQRDRLHRESLQILVSGFDCTRIYYIPISPEMLLDEDNLKVLTVNRSRLIEPIPWDCYLWFEPLYENFRKTPKDLAKIFSRIQTVDMETSDQKLVGLEASDVVNFLAETKVAELILKDYNFQREFYELLPAVQSIKRLRITERSLASEDYAHIAELKNLSFISIESEKLSIEFVRKFLNLRFFEQLNFNNRFFPKSIKKGIDLSIFKERECYALNLNAISSKYYYGSSKSIFEKPDRLIEAVVGLESDNQVNFLLP